jgi:hypothetical protein
MTAPVPQCQPKIVERLRSSEPLPACPFDRISPHYLTMPDDKPCPFCGQENTLDGPDKCRGADTRIMGEAADEIVRLTARVEELEKEMLVTADYLKKTSDRLTMVLSQESWTPRRSHTEGDRNAFVSAEHTLLAVLQPKGAV